jgi:hypothetical protein
MEQQRPVTSQADLVGHLMRQFAMENFRERWHISAMTIYDCLKPTEIYNYLLSFPAHSLQSFPGI